jgi:general secretion pathway protein I
MHHKKTNQGFTLIEILIALMIVSIALVAIIKAQNTTTKTLNYLKTKTIANLVISNLSVENRLGKKAKLGYASGEYPMANNIWYWQTYTTKNKLTTKLSFYEQKINLYQNKKNKEAKDSIAQLTIYLK